MSSLLRKPNGLQRGVPLCGTSGGCAAPVRELVAPKRQGFTLLEVLLGMVLSIALLSGLWASLNLYTKIFSSGHVEVEQSQLVRGILSKMSLELRAAVPPKKGESTSSSASAEEDPMAALSSSSYETTGVSGLRGDAHSIEIDMVQPLVEMPRSIDSIEATTNAMSTPQVPELVSVRYYLAEEDLVTPITDGVGTAEAAGLVRYARAWAGYPGSEDDLAAGEISSSQIRSSLPDTTAESEADALPPGFLSGEEGENLPQLLASEVVQIEFRYYDGEFWASQWDSRSQGGLPLAVEVAIAIPKPAMAGNANEPGASLNSPTEDPLAADMGTELRGVSLFESEGTALASTADQLPWTVSRLLVALPLGGKPAESSATEGDATESGSDTETDTSETGASAASSGTTGSESSTGGVTNVGSNSSQGTGGTP